LAARATHVADDQLVALNVQDAELVSPDQYSSNGADIVLVDDPGTQRETRDPIDGLIDLMDNGSSGTGVILRHT
jgi:hypothetical protein